MRVCLKCERCTPHGLQAVRHNVQNSSCVLVVGIRTSPCPSAFFIVFLLERGAELGEGIKSGLLAGVES